MKRKTEQAPMKRIVRRDSWGFGVPCEQPGCYEIGLEPDGKCERHSPFVRRDR